MVTELPQSTIPMFLDIYREVEKTEYGQVNLSITVHRHFPVGMVTNSFREERFAPGENTKAAESLLGYIQRMVKNKKTGTLSMTLVFDAGKIKELTTQFYDKKKYD